MPSIFSRSHSTPRKDKSATFTTPQRNGPLSPPSTSKNGRYGRQSGTPALGEFGALQNVGGSKTLPSRPVQPLTPPLSPEGEVPPPLLPPRYTFLPTRIPPHTPSDNSVDSFSYSTDEVTGMRVYGFLGGIGNRVTLGLEDVGRVVRDIGKELMRRGLATPMLFSSQALELVQTRVKILITAYLDLISGHSSRPRPADVFLQDLTFEREHELAWLLRWALSRVTRIREGTRDVCHGLVEWDAYEEWRGRERVAGYPTNAFPFLANILPIEVYDQVLIPLFHLLSRFAAHSHLSGLTPHALSSLFAPAFFDIPTSTPALAAHASFVRAASATEHLLLAYIRSTSSKGSLGLSDLPFRLKAWVAGYPAMLASDADLARGSPRKGARLVRCERATRTVRAYSKDLVVHAELWADDARGNWEPWDRVTWKARRGELSRPKFSAAWRRRMMVKETLPLPSSSATPGELSRKMSYGRALKPGQRGRERHNGIEEDPEEARWGSLAGKEWSMFEEGGFDAPSLISTEQGGADIRKRLQFDLTESAKLSIAERRQTMDWSDFAAPTGGFNRTDPLLDVSLTFSAPIETSITDWPKERDELRRRLQKSQKEATPFEYDTTPRFGADAATDPSSGVRADAQGRVYVEEAFVDCWADLMMGAGWMDREELTFRDANWALIEYKAKPARMDNTDVDPFADPRTTELYILFEERVPLEYQLAVADPKQPKKSGFSLFSPKSKKRNTAMASSASADAVHRLAPGWESNDFDRMLMHRQQTRKVTLTKSASDQPNSSVWHLTRDRDPTPLASPTKGRQRTRIDEYVSRNSQERNGGDDPEVGETKGIFFNKSGGGKNKVIRRVKTDESTREKVEKAQQKEQDVDFELHSASGLSSGGTSPRDGKQGKEDEKWMDILIANGARRMDRQDAVPPPVPQGARRPGGIGLPASPHPPGKDELTTPLEHEGVGRPSGGHTPRLGPGPGPERQRSIRRKAVPSDDEAAESGFEPASPSSDSFNRGNEDEGGDGEGEGEIRFSGSGSSTRPQERESYDSERSEGPELFAPKPRRERDARDTIHNIVDQYERESISLQPDLDMEPMYEDEAPRPYPHPHPRWRERYSAEQGGEDYFSQPIAHTGLDHDYANVDLGAPVGVGIQELNDNEIPNPGNHGQMEDADEDEAGLSLEDRHQSLSQHEEREEGEKGEAGGAGTERKPLKPPHPIFDLTPGREPSPARYKHGEPLHFVGEEPEEEETY